MSIAVICMFSYVPSNEEEDWTCSEEELGGEEEDEEDEELGLHNTRTLNERCCCCCWLEVTRGLVSPVGVVAVPSSDEDPRAGRDDRDDDEDEGPATTLFEVEFHPGIH